MAKRLFGAPVWVIRSSTALLLALLNGVSTASIGANHLVGLLKDQQAIDGCSWSASSPSVGQGFIYLADLDSAKTLMNIDGVDTQLNLVTEHGKLSKVGDVLEREFKAGEVSIHARYTVVWTCPKNSYSCEVTKYDVIFEVSKGSRRQVVRARGDFGC